MTESMSTETVTQLEMSFGMGRTRGRGLTVVFRHDRLLGNGTELNLDIDDSDTLCADIDIHKTRVHGLRSRDQPDLRNVCLATHLVKLPESGNQPNRSLFHPLVRIRELRCVCQQDFTLHSAILTGQQGIAPQTPRQSPRALIKLP